MSVSDGQDATAVIFNAAYFSKITDSTGSAKYTLDRPASGDTVDDVQAAINNGLWQTIGEETIAAGGTVSSDLTSRFQYRRIKASAVATHSLSATPFGTGGSWSDGIVIRLVCTSDSEIIRITHSDVANGMLVSGDVDMKKGSVLTFQWDAVLVRWIEVGRSI